MEKSPCKLNLLHCRQKTMTSLWNRNEKGIGKTRKMRSQANSARYNTQGWDMRGGGGKWRDSGRGRGWTAPLCQLICEPGEMVWQYIYFSTLIKKGTFTYSDSNPCRNQKMWRCCSQIASDYMKSCINPLRLVSAPPSPLPAPPPLSQASVLIASLVNLTRGTQGCPKIIS